MSKKLLALVFPIVILLYLAYPFVWKRDFLKIGVSEFGVDTGIEKIGCNGDAFIHLLQQIVSFKSTSERRKNEYLNTFQQNVKHPCVRYIYVPEETWEERTMYTRYISDFSKKVKFIPFGRRPSYRDMFRIVSEYILPNFKEGDLWMVANADIVLDRGFEKLHNTVDNRTLIVLSRHTKYCKEKNMCLNLDGGSMDSFLGSMYVSKIISDALHFFQNTFGAENEVTYNFEKHGFKAVNPCKSIITIHNHCSKDRPWLSRPNARKRVDKYYTHVQAQMWPPTA